MPTTVTAFSAPAKIGTLIKPADQSRATTLLTRLKSGGYERPFAVVYKDRAAPERSALVWGDIGSVFGALNAYDGLKLFFDDSAKQFTGGTMAHPVDAEPSAVGGVAQCAEVTGMGVRSVLCAWVTDNALLAFLFNGLTLDLAFTEMESMLRAIVTLG